MIPMSLREQARKEGAHLDLRLKSPLTAFRVRNFMETVGFAGLLWISPTTATIRGWWVHPHFRGQGWGKKLLSVAVTHASEEGAEIVNIRTTHAELVECLGFTWTGYERRLGHRERHYVRSIERKA